jgi:type I restriction enzyme M protein
MAKAKPQTNKTLGQFWTPPAIAEFMLEIVKFDPLWKVIDPACGEGIFLLKAAERGGSMLVGVDIDPEAIERAKKLLQPYRERVRLYCQDGLEEIADENSFWRGNFDLVIGNPPFAATGYRVRDPKVLARFELAKVPVEEETYEIEGQGRLFQLTVQRKRQQPSQAIEVLFLERFIQLCKPGGRICIILPHGVFANSNLKHVRAWILANFTIRAIISLPRDTFKAVGTTAKTGILVLEKKKPKSRYFVRMAEIEQVQPDAPLDEKHNPQLVRLLKGSLSRMWEEDC